MKRYKKTAIFCGISGKPDSEGNYSFTVDFNHNTDDDVIQFVEPFNIEKPMAGVDVCWFGYQYNPNIKGAYRQQCIKFLENVKGTPVTVDDDSGEIYIPSNSDNIGICDEDLGIMIDRSLRNMKLNDYLIDTIIYPVSQSNNLNHYIVKYVKQYLLNSDRLSFYQLIKADPKGIQYLHNAENVLIVDDNNTTGTTVTEVIRRIREYNDTCNIYVFTLTGSM